VAAIMLSLPSHFIVSVSFLLLLVTSSSAWIVPHHQVRQQHASSLFMSDGGGTLSNFTPRDEWLAMSKEERNKIFEERRLASTQSPTTVSPTTVAPSMQSPTTSLPDSEIFKGSVKFFDKVKGYGFITNDDGGEDIFVHETGFQEKSIGVGTPVEFKIEVRDGKPRAARVTSPGGEPLKISTKSPATISPMTVAPSTQSSTTALLDPGIFKGSVKFFDKVKGYGFITNDDGGEDIFVHESGFQAKSIGVGTPVEFQIEVRDGKPRAARATSRPGGEPLKISSKSPKVSTKSPKIPTKSPKISSKSPKNSTKSPKISAKSPKISTKSPATVSPPPSTQSSTTASLDRGIFTTVSLDPGIFEGSVKWFDKVKGFGFITRLGLDGGEDIFFHQSSIFAEGFRAVENGEAVEFQVEVTEGKSTAVRVTGPGGEALKRGFAYKKIVDLVEV
jgi:cold shock CspA family protein